MKSWGFLHEHRMFHAVVSAVPRGYMVELRVPGDRLAWAVAEGRTVDKAMRSAAVIACNELALRGAVIREQARARQTKRRAKSPEVLNSRRLQPR